MNDYEFTELVRNTAPSFHTIMKMINDDSPARTVHANASLEPVEAQKLLGVGDTAVMISAGASVDSEIACMELLDPREYESVFPDWKSRCEKDFVLVNMHAPTDPAGLIGWVSRVQCAPLPKEEHDKIRDLFFTTANPFDLSDAEDEELKACHEICVAAGARINDARSKDAGFTPLMCSKCESADTYVRTRQSRVAKVKVVVDQDGDLRIAQTLQEDDSRSAVAICKNCGHSATIPAEKLK